MLIGRRDLLCGLLGANLLVLPALSADSPPAGRRVALRGYDPVAYFTESSPQKGRDEFWYAFDDAVYFFKNGEHRTLFAADPEKYAPQYAGYCAGGVSKGYATEPDPEAWAMLNGKLYVFELKERVPSFKQDTSFIQKADANWPGVKPAGR